MATRQKKLSPKQDMHEKRHIDTTRGRELLKEGKYSVTEVAERTGFCDGKYFREVFKKYFNVSPSQYAKGDTPRSPKGEGE